MIASCYTLAAGLTSRLETRQPPLSFPKFQTNTSSSRVAASASNLLFESRSNLKRRQDFQVPTGSAGLQDPGWQYSDLAGFRRISGFEWMYPSQ
jgi:hypothetical protein